MQHLFNDGRTGNQLSLTLHFTNMLPSLSVAVLFSPFPTISIFHSTHMFISVGAFHPCVPLTNRPTTHSHHTPSCLIQLLQLPQLSIYLDRDEGKTKGFSVSSWRGYELLRALSSEAVSNMSPPPTPHFQNNN